MLQTVLVTTFVLSLAWWHGTALICYDQVKCYGNGFYRNDFKICDQTDPEKCRYNRFDEARCSANKGGLYTCEPDWFHASCECTDQITHGELRCKCELDRRPVIAVVVLSIAVVILVILATYCCVTLTREKRKRRDATIEMNTINRALELGGSLGTSVAGGGNTRGFPPQPPLPNQQATGHVIANAASSEKPPCYDNIYYPPEDNADPLPQRADVI